MKKGILLFMVATLLLTACNNYGKKAQINSKSEVYYKGDGVTEADAKKLGAFLVQNGFFNNTDERSVQLSKDSGAYVIRLVVDTDKVNKNKEEILSSFKAWQYIIAQNVFPDAETKLVLTNDHFEDFLPVGELTAAEKAQLQQELNKESEPTADDTIPNQSVTPSLPDTAIKDSGDHL